MIALCFLTQTASGNPGNGKDNERGNSDRVENDCDHSNDGKQLGFYRSARQAPQRLQDDGDHGRFDAVQNLGYLWQ